MTMSEPREYTPEEVKQHFLDHIWEMIEYWDKLKPRTGARSQRERLEGLAFSLLVTLDGCSGGMPGFIVAPSTHESDKEYHKEQGENWYPQNNDAKVNCDIGGTLHDDFYPAGERLGYHKMGPHKNG
jgi:hypothetical protein